MSTLLPFIVVGATTGSVYGLAAMGLVLSYKTSGIFNFAHGAIATVAACVFYELHVLHGWPWPIAAVATVLVVGPVLGTALERLAFVLAAASSSMKIVATVGLLISIQALAVIRYGSVTRQLAQFLPTGAVHFAGVNVGVDQLIAAGISVAALVALTTFFRVSRLGLAMHAVVDDPDLLGLTGTAPARVRRTAWAIGSSFAAVSGILLAPTFGLDALLLTLLIVQAFGAAAIGGFSSLPLTFAGGIIVGIAASVATKYVATTPALGGIPPSVPFIVLFVVLLVSPKGRLPELGGQLRRRVVERRVAPPRQRAIGLAVLAVALLLVPHVVGTRLPIYTTGLVFVVLFLSLGLLVRTSNQVSLCQLGFAAVGGAAFSHLAHSVGLPWPIALVGAGLVTIPVGALIALPAIRLSGLYLALATLGFGILLERMAYASMFLFGRKGLRPAPRPSFASGDTAYYYVVLAAVLCAFAVVIAVERGRLGQLLRAMGDSPVALAAHGTNVNVTRLLVFCISAFLAGIGGALLGPLSGTVTASSFNSFQSLILLAVLAIMAAYSPGPITAAVAASASFVVLPAYFRSPTFSTWLQVVFGASAVLAAMAETGRLGRGDLTARLAARAERRRAASPVRARARAVTS